MKTYDIIIIGGGAGGLTSAYTAKGFGKKVLLVEKNKLGGECTWSGCIPSKALINISKDIYIAKKFSEFNIDTQNILQDVKSTIYKVYQNETPTILNSYGIETLKGEAKFFDKNSIIVNKEIYRAKNFIISTGSSPSIPPIKGINKIHYLTNETFFKLNKLPNSMIILGGGPIGIEIAQAINRLGVNTTVVELEQNILIREEIELVKMLSYQIEKEGVKILTRTKSIEIEENDKKIVLTVNLNNQIKKIGADSILIATGRKPNLDLNLDKVQVKYDKKGILTNKFLQTTNQNIYAIGDVTGLYQFSHMANYQGIIATQNIILPILKRKISYKNVSWCTFTEPELARIGLTETEASKIYSNTRTRIYKVNFDDLDRAKTQKDDIGIIKLICNNKGYLLGAHVLGKRAGEIISELQLIKSKKINMSELSNIAHPYPTYSEILYSLGKKISIDNFLNNPFVILFKKFLNK